MLAVLNAYVLKRTNAVSKKFDVLLEKGKIKDFKDLIVSHSEKVKLQDQKMKEMILRIKMLENISKKTFQKIGVVRFNPFNELGGNQSFVIALLDDQNNGFVLSSLFVNEGNRVYSKPVKYGKSTHKLSNEEKEAIANAMKDVVPQT